MKRFLFSVLCLSLLGSFAYGKNPRIDSLALYLLTESNIRLQNIQSCRFTAEISYDVWGDDVGLIKHSSLDKIYMKFPDKMYINAIGDKGHKALWYNGNILSYYSFINNQYAQTSAPNSILETIDTLSKALGIEFPAADFFYPTFVSDILNTGCNLIYLGIAKVGERDCFHIAGKSETASFQFWIANDETLLPVKMAIVYTSEKHQPQYEAVFNNWELEGNYPDAMFDFNPPPTADKIKFAHQK